MGNSMVLICDEGKLRGPHFFLLSPRIFTHQCICPWFAVHFLSLPDYPSCSPWALLSTSAPAPAPSSRATGTQTDPGAGVDPVAWLVWEGVQTRGGEGGGWEEEGGLSLPSHPVGFLS